MLDGINHCQGKPNTMTGFTLQFKIRTSRGNLAQPLPSRVSYPARHQRHAIFIFKMQITSTFPYLPINKSGCPAQSFLLQGVTKVYPWVWGCSSVVKQELSMYKALDSSQRKKKQKCHIAHMIIKQVSKGNESE